MAARKAPEGLQRAGKAVWSSIAAKYELRADELHRLEGICKTADMIASLEGVWVEKGCPTETKGSMGQEIIHPLIGELRAQRAAFDAALVRLKLPDDESGAVPVNQQRDAAASKWAVGKGRGA
jgi:hypothetical protein